MKIWQKHRTWLGKMRVKVPLRDAIAHRFGYVNPENVELLVYGAPPGQVPMLMMRANLPQCARLQLLAQDIFSGDISGHIDVKLAWLRGEPLPMRELS